MSKVMSGRVIDRLPDIALSIDISKDLVNEFSNELTMTQMRVESKYESNQEPQAASTRHGYHTYPNHCRISGEWYSMGKG